MTIDMSGVLGEDVERQGKGTEQNRPSGSSIGDEQGATTFQGAGLP